MLIDVELALDNLGIDYEIHGAEANAICPQHFEQTGKEDHSPSWWINLDSGQHICFSCGYKGNLARLVCDIKGFKTEVWGAAESYDFTAAQAWLADISSIPVEKLQEMIASLPNRLKETAKPLEMSEARLAVFVNPPLDALNQRNLTAESAKKYGVLWDNNKSAWVLPLRDPHFHRLMGWQEKGTTTRTFMNRPTGLQKSKTLFGVDVQDAHLAILVESPLDCVRLDSAGVSGGLASCGAAVSEQQLKLLRNSGRVIAAFDNPNVDAAGKKASEELRLSARKYGLNLSFFNYGDSVKKDIGDMTDEEIHWGIENAKSSVLGESAYVYRGASPVSS